MKEDDHAMRLRVNLGISVLALMAIGMEVHAMEVLEQRRTDAYLQRQFEELNRRFFDGGLPPTNVVWADLRDDDGLTTRYDDGSFVIQIDRRGNFLYASELDDTLKHETCHVATYGQDADPHGPAFRDCMARVK
jgi:hypothetical protein